LPTAGTRLKKHRASPCNHSQKTAMDDWVVDQALVNGFLMSEPSNPVDQHVQAFIENLHIKQKVDGQVITDMAKDGVAARGTKSKLLRHSQGNQYVH
jgi:hypothetical protein